MTLTNMVSNFNKNVISIKYRIFITSFVGYIGLIYIAQKWMNTMPKYINVSILDMFCDVYKGLGIVGMNTYIFPIIPLFAFILISVIDCDNNTMCLIRYGSRNNIWKKQFIASINIAFWFSILIILGGYIISGLLVGSFDNKWIGSEGTIYKLLREPSNFSEISNKFVSYKILFFIFTSNFLGLCAIGSLICIGKIFLKNQYVCLLLVINLFISALFKNYFSILTKMVIKLENLINPIIIMKNDIYLISLIILLYIIGNKIMSKKDIINKI